VEKVAAKEGEQEDAPDPTASGGDAAEVTRLTQVWWLENEIQAVHYYLKKAR
jgi:hypothetical protein